LVETLGITPDDALGQDEVGVVGGEQLSDDHGWVNDHHLFGVQLR
jgi:hypothetical protein